MRGTAFTVFQGNEPEPFPVEILGVLPGAIGPKQDLIIGRLTGGPGRGETQVFAGMSGSPFGGAACARQTTENASSENNEISVKRIENNRTYTALNFLCRSLEIW